MTHQAESSAQHAEPVVARFVCSQCGALAAQLTLGRDLTLRQTDFWGVTSEAIAPARYPTVVLILTRSDAAALYDLNLLWAPFYCPDCRRIYCYTHWQIEQRYDDDFPGWYDCAYGTCPQGHRRLIDD